MNWTEQIAAVFSWLPTEPKVMFDGWGNTAVTTLLSVAGAAFLWLIARLRKPNTASIQHDASDWLAKNRRKLLDRFQRELDDRRHSFLLGKEPLELDKILAPQEVAHPHSLQDSIACTLERDGLAVETTDQPIAALFNRPEVGRRLAILGEPGSGKTVCLLKLCGHLLQEAAADESAPLPVIFECSEWDSRDLLLWMAWQLHRKHHFPEDTARQLVQTGDIFPLFDGLDELAAERQRDFVRAFNAFAEGRHLVLCCRLEEYRQLRNTAGQKLALSNAAILQDIAPARLEEHLRQQGLDALCNQIEHSENLLQLARRPLFLALMSAVADKLRQGSGLRQGESEEDFLWRLYLNDCLAPTRPDHGRKCNKEQSLRWLRCLARWMQERQKVELRIEELQPSMLKHYWLSGLLYGLFVGLLFGLMGWLFAGLMIRMVAVPVTGLMLGSMLAKDITLNYQIKIEALCPLRFPVSWHDWRGLIVQIAGWLSLGLTLSLLFIVTVALIHREAIVCIEVKAIGLELSLVLGLAAGLIAGWFVGLAEAVKAVAGPINETILTQQDLNNILRSCLRHFPLFLLVGMIVFMFIVAGKTEESKAIYVILLWPALLSFFALGTNAMLQHHLLRLCLHWEGQLPLRLVPWLEAMQQRKVLQRVGGSYHFLHKQLQEYLAKSNVA